MSDLQHQRIVELCQELRMSAMPNLYSGIAQSAAAKEASFADFLEETLRAERDARSARDSTHVDASSTPRPKTHHCRLTETLPLSSAQILKLLDRWPS